MSTKRRKFSEEFKADAVQLVVQGERPVAQVARELEINESSLGYWVTAYRSQHPDPHTAPLPVEAARVARLEAENRRLAEENAFLHHAVDDYSRLAYSEILSDERKHTAAGFWERARAFFADAGITVSAVMTDNGSCYRSQLFTEALGKNVTYRFTRPYRPQTNGKVERFNRTLNQEWAYAETYLSDEARAATYADWLHRYNHHRPHTGIGGSTPAQRVHNLTGKNN